MPWTRDQMAARAAQEAYNALQRPAKPYNVNSTPNQHPRTARETV